MKKESYLPGVVEDERTCHLMSEVSHYLDSKEGLIEPYSAEDYFLMLLDRGLQTRMEGNYGIAAALVYREQGEEIIVFGKNTVFSESNPHGHAEMNAIRNAASVITDSSGRAWNEMSQRGDIVCRPAPDQNRSVFLVTTLEPCPMCTVGSVINPKVDQVLVGTKDEYAGSLVKERMEGLPPLWPATASKQELKVIIAQSENPEEKATYISQKLSDYLKQLFFDTKERLDKKLDNEGFIDLTLLGLLAKQYSYE